MSGIEYADQHPKKEQPGQRKNETIIFCNEKNFQRAVLSINEISGNIQSSSAVNTRECAWEKRERIRNSRSTTP